MQNKKIAIILFIVAYALLYPGLTEPLLTITGNIDKKEIAIAGTDVITKNPDTPQLISDMATLLIENMNISGNLEAYNETRSIISTIQELYNNNNILVAFLIGLFSIIIPMLKGIMLIMAAISKTLAPTLNRISDMISRWSMADVFVIAILVAYLAANAFKDDSGLLAFDARLGSGFYFFLGYCLISILATQILVSKNKKRNQN